ncbi:MFS transporter [Microbacterium resistens]|uniref:MFS transporter n=1 Tax=Microbacterium resistens TaxID=156977 RepID=A0ABY3RVT5_9MICO|nr:MFS transporter [Microbacterium resistens]UGS27038.1 MFS transporter [Microbacterium resistens]
MTAPVPVIPSASRTSRGLLPALLCAVLSYSLMQTLLVPALPSLVDGLRLDAAGGGWVLTSYLVSGAIAAPVLGALGDRFGHRRVLLAAMGLFVAGSVLCVVAPVYPPFLLGRVLQGASTASFPLALAIVRRHVAADEQPAAVGWLSGTLGLGAGAALVIGGFIAEALSWPWLFAVGALLGVLSIVLVATLVPHAVRAEPSGSLDAAGAALLGGGLVALLLAVAQGSTWGWGSPAVLALAGCAAVCLVSLWAVEKRVSRPLVDVRVLSRPALASVNLLTLLLGFTPYLFYVGLPVLFQAAHPAGFGMDVAQTGFAMLPGAVLVFLGGRLAPWLLARIRPAAVAVLAMLAMGLGSAGAMLLPASLPAIVSLFALVGLGNGIGFALAADLVSRLVPRNEIAAAVGVNGVLRTVGSAFGTPITMLIVAGGAAPSAFVLLFGVAAAVSVVGVVLGATVRV